MFGQQPLLGEARVATAATLYMLIEEGEVDPRCKE